MELWEAAILGIVQGLCEFLPVSSSGHLVLTRTLLGVDAPGLLMDTMLHVGTLFALLYVYWHDVWNMVGHPRQKPLWLLVVATLPAVIATLLFGDFFDTAFGGAYLGISFLITAALLLTAEYLGRPRDKKMGFFEAAVIEC